MWKKESLKKGSRFSRENLLSVLEMSLPLDYGVYLWMFSSASGELFKVITSLIQKGDVIMIDCCGILQIKLYTVNIVVKQCLMYRLLVRVWITSYKC